MRILIVEDEPKVSAFIKQGLEEQSYEVELAYDGQMGIKLGLEHSFDVVLIDIVLPYYNGKEVCSKIKAQKPNLPIMMLTALGTTEDKVNGFDAGADDYLVKPFEFAELLARIRALTKRNSGIAETSNMLKVFDLELDLNKKVAVRDGNEILLTAKEFALLEYLMRNKGHVVSRVDIVEKVWDLSFDTGTNLVDVYINLLRKKIDKDFEVRLIHTRVGMGYMFNDK